jgi:glucose-1-phosphate thymidylyltransferase
MRQASAAVELRDDQARAAAAGLKPMIPVGDETTGAARPFLDYVLSSLADAGFRDVGLVVGPEHDVIQQRYAEVVRPERLCLTWLIQAEPLGTADAVLAAGGWVGDEPFIVVNADNLYPVSALAELRESAGPALAAFEPHELVRSSNVPADRVPAFALLEVDAQGRLTGIVEKPGAEAVSRAGPRALVSMNAWRFDRRIFGACRDVPRSARGEFELSMAVGLAIDRGVPFHAFVARGEVLDMSNQADVAAVSRRLAGRVVQL